MIQPNCTVYKDKTEYFLPPGLPQTIGKQPDGIITWSLKNSSGDIPDTHKEFIAIAGGITQWGLQLKNITFQHVPWTQNANVKIEFVIPSDPRYSGLFASDSTLAQTYYPIPQNGALAGCMFLNGDFREIWSLDGVPIPCSQALATGHATGCVDPTQLIQTFKLTTVTRHEFGHALGLPHLDKGNTMTAFYADMPDKLGPEDIQLSQGLYGNRGIEQHIIDSVDSLIARNVGLV